MSKEPTISELVAYAMARSTKMTEVKARALIKENKVRSYSKLDTLVKPSVAAVKTAAQKRVAKVREAGPRGWVFGPKWIESVKAVAGIAISPANRVKLEAMAEANSVKVVSGMTSEAIAQKLAPLV